MTARPVRASIIVVGDEILDGHTRDTNSGLLAALLAGQGVAIDRIVTVPDEIAAIHEALTAELGRSRPRLLVTSGGIGTTPDDLTMEAVATYLGVGLVTEPALAARIAGWAERARAQGTPRAHDELVALDKLARIPEGARLLAGAAAATPGAITDLDGGLSDGGVSLVILPGVPEEFERLARDNLVPLVEGRGVNADLVELTHPYPEARLTPTLADLAARYPEVSVGSYPGEVCTLRIKGPRAGVREVAETLRARIARLGAPNGGVAEADER